MAELTYREAVSRAIAQEMERDPSVYFIGEDVAAAGGVFKTTEGLLERFGPSRVRDTPISEQAIIGAVMGAAMNGLRPVAELMFSDFFAVCWDLIANQIAKTRYMTNGQVALPLVIRTANGGGVRFGAQHSQSVEGWAMAIPGLKVVVPSTPVDMIGLFAAAVRDPDPVIVVEPKVLYASKGEVPDGEIVDRLGSANVVRTGDDVTICALGAMVPKAFEAAERLAADGIDAEVIDVRSLVPLDVTTILDSVAKTGRFVTVEESPRLCGWGAEVASIVAEERFFDLDGPLVRITTPHLPLPAADALEDLAIPSVDRHRRAGARDDGLMARHAVRPRGEATWGVPTSLEGHREGFRRWTAVDESAGAVHTGFGIGEFDPGGRIDWHVHSYEESLYILEGEIVLFTSEAAVLLRPGDYGLIPVGQSHALANDGRDAARWAALSAPQPRPAHGGDTFFVPALPSSSPSPVDARDPRTRSFGHIEPEHMDPASRARSCWPSRRACGRRCSSTAGSP